jgi:hypothetical protein
MIWGVAKIYAKQDLIIAGLNMVSSVFGYIAPGAFSI